MHKSGQDTKCTSSCIFPHHVFSVKKKKKSQFHLKISEETTGIITNLIN